MLLLVVGCCYQAEGPADLGLAVWIPGICLKIYLDERKGWDVINSLSERVLQRKCFLGRHTEAIVSITELGKYRHSNGEQQSEGRMGTCTCALPIYFISQLPQSPLIGMGSLEILVKVLLHTQLGKTRVCCQPVLAIVLYGGHCSSQLPLLNISLAQDCCL